MKGRPDISFNDRNFLVHVTVNPYYVILLLRKIFHLSRYLEVSQIEFFFLEIIHSLENGMTLFLVRGNDHSTRIYYLVAKESLQSVYVDVYIYCVTFHYQIVTHTGLCAQINPWSEALQTDNRGEIKIPRNAPEK